MHKKKNNIDADPKYYFRANSQQHALAQSKNLYCSKRDVSTTVDMTSSRFSECGSTAILLPKKNGDTQKSVAICSILKLKLFSLCNYCERNLNGNLLVQLNSCLVRTDFLNCRNHDNLAVNLETELSKFLGNLDSTY